MAGVWKRSKVTQGQMAFAWAFNDWTRGDAGIGTVLANLFKLGDVELTDEPLLDVLQAVGDLIKIPVLVDGYGLKADGIDLKTKKVSHKKKRTVWSAALKHVCFQARCKWELRVDEAGHPLLWVMSDIPPKDHRDKK